MPEVTYTKGSFSTLRPLLTCDNNVVVEFLIDISIDHKRLVIVLVANGVRVEEARLRSGAVVDAIGAETERRTFS